MWAARRVTALLLLCALVAGYAAAIRAQVVIAAQPSFRGSVTAISPTLAKRMSGVSWHPGCPVPLSDLRVVRATYNDFDGNARQGTVIVNRDVAATVLAILRRLYGNGFPIRRMIPVDAYGASDFRSIEADNTSAFNCRYVDGTSRWSQHAYGRAIDINPIENPYATISGTTSHTASRPFVRRVPFRPGMAAEGRALVRAFDAAGWGWGGRWSGARDFQHFSASGR